MTSDRANRARLTFSVLGSIGVAGMFVIGLLNGLENDRITPLSGTLFLLLLLISIGPFVAYYLTHESLRGTVLTGSLMIVVMTVVYSITFLGESSTSGIGLLVAPIAAFGVWAIGLPIDRAFMKSETHLADAKRSERPPA